MRQPVRMLLVLTICLIASSGTAAAATYYDGTLGALPGPPAWLYPPNLPALHQMVGNVAVLDTTGDQAIQTGYGLFTPPVFDRNVGYTITFDVRVVAESHSSTDRAGFSITSLSSDLQGIELGFWQDRIWAQNDNPLFTHGEYVTCDTTAAMTRYTLAIEASNYSLYAGSDPTPILSGALRDYSAHPSGVYDTPNLLFFGDDTTSAAARVELGYVAAVPEPASVVLLAIGGAVLYLHLRRRRAQPA